MNPRNRLDRTLDTYYKQKAIDWINSSSLYFNNLEEEKIPRFTILKNLILNKIYTFRHWLGEKIAGETFGEY